MATDEQRRTTAVVIVVLVAITACRTSPDATTDATQAIATTAPTAAQQTTTQAVVTTTSTTEQPTTTQAIATTTSMSQQPTTTSVAPGWSGAVRDPSDVDQSMVLTAGRSEFPSLTWQDPLDVSAGWVDVKRVRFDAPLGSADDGQIMFDAATPHWRIELADRPPPTTELEPGVLISYGLVLETTGDTVADYLIGIDNDAPNQGDFHVWVTDLATGETDDQIGPPYGYPIEFRHPDEQRPGVGSPDDPPMMYFTFLDGGPADLNIEKVRFYVWTSATHGDDVLAYDYAPDTGWITADTRSLWDAQIAEMNGFGSSMTPSN